MKSLEETIVWSAAPEPLNLGRNEVHLWTVPLHIAPAKLEQLALVLSADEQERARKFRFDRHRHRFIAGRAALRTILSRYLESNPAAIQFTYAAQGKPALTSTGQEANLHFNLGHSEDLALLGITRIGNIGVDIERIRVVKDADDLVARFFSQREREQFQKLSADEKPGAFFNLWTRKEAMLKATGEGITRSLHLIEVSFGSDEPAQVLAINGDKDEAAAWTLRNLTPAPGFVGAMAIRASDVVVRNGDWKA